jgi:hypothetical protein
MFTPSCETIASRTVLPSDAPDRSLAPMLDRVRRALPPVLVSEDAFRRLQSAARQLPDALTSLLYVEARLHASDAVDLVLRVGAESRALLLTGEIPSGARCEGGRDAAWDRVRALVSAWERSERDCAAALHHLWLEFDVDTIHTARTLIPGVFACFGELPVPGFTPERWHGYAVEALETLFGASLANALYHDVAAAFAKLPSGAYVPYVGAMLGRDEQSVRICLLGMDTATLFKYLEQLRGAEWTAPHATLIAELANAQPDGPLRGQYLVHLDVGERGLWRLGVEFACSRKEQLRGALTEQELLRRLVALGLARGDKCVALNAWPGTMVTRVPGVDTERVVVRRVNHLKIVLRPEREPEAKAYLAAQYFPRDELHPRVAPAQLISRHAERVA